MTEPSHAVFLSYASEDAEAAQRIADALRAAGIEVWFDQSELRGGDAWDRMIHDQIQACALFMPIISANAHARVEGYFRLEWKLAVDRSHRMAPDQPFLMPVAIDDTRQNDTRIPDRFRELHWTRLLAGETTPAFIERIKRLLSPEHSPAPDRASSVGSAAPRSASAPRAPSRWSMGTLYAAIPVALLLIAGYFGPERLYRSKPSVAGAASIAVLPLANESGEASQQYFSDGISEDLITALSQFPGLKVIGRTSAFQFRDSKEDSRSIGAKLGVAHLLEGSVRRAGEMVRVSAELIDAADGSTQWSERYDRPYKDLFALQDEITHAVAGALRTKLLPDEHAAAQSDRPSSGNLDAYNVWLQGNFYGARDTEGDIRHAIDLFRTATQRDPRYAVAWSSLSVALSSLSAEFLGGAAARQAYAEGRSAAKEALAIAPDSARAHAAQGLVLTRADLDWNGAEAEFNRAAELAPNDAEVKFWLGLQLAITGKPERAVDLTRQALATDPLRGYWFNWLALYLVGLNRNDEAEAAVRKAIELQPAAPRARAGRVVIEILRGEAQAALDFAQQVPPGVWRDTALALARQVGTDRAAADAALKMLIEKDADISSYQIAQAYALRQDADNAFGWLDRAWSNRDVGVGLLLFDPFILRYKDDPRFVAFCRKVGLPTPAEVAAHKS